MLRLSAAHRNDGPPGGTWQDLWVTGFDASAILAVVLGVLLIPLLFIPYVAWSYRRGLVGVGHAVLSAAAVVYAMALWTYTILPLPQAEALRCEGPGPRQLVPFAFVGDMAWGPGLFADPALHQVLLNVALFVPLGVLARHLFGLSAWWTVGLGALVSLLIELTQLTGVWGLYACAYRLFDVDDLLANTAGAALGVLLAPLAALVPGQHSRPADQPTPVRPLRRLMGAAVDLLSVSLIGLCASLGVALVSVLTDRPGDELIERADPVASLVAAVVLLLLVPMRWGATVGQRLVFLRPVRSDLAPPRPQQWLRRMLGGVGGYAVLRAAADLGLPGGGALANAWVVVALLVIGLLHTRGVSGYVSGLVVIDSREPDPRSRVRSRGVDPRRMSSAVLAFAGGVFVAAALVAAALTALGTVLPEVAVGMVMVAGLAVLLLAGCALVGYVLYAGIVVVRREGRSAGNLLALLSVVAMVLLLAVLVVAVLTQWRWLVVLSVTGLGVSGYLGFLFGAFLLYGQVYGRATPEAGIDAVIVLGSRIFDETVPPLLAARIERGMQVHAAEVERGGRPLLVLSGGQGPDEPAPEGEVMARYALEHGADPDLVRAEGRSTTTEENLTFSADIVREEGLGSELVVATNDFHAFRAAIIAGELGVRAQVVGAPTARYFFPSAVLREFVGVLARSPVRHLFAILGAALLSGGIALLLTRF